MIAPLRISYEVYQELKTKYIDPYLIEGTDDTYSSLKACILATTAPHGGLFATWRKKDGKELHLCNGKLDGNNVDNNVKKQPS